MTRWPWVDAIVAAAAVVTALAVLWRKVIRPAWRTLDELADVVPTLRGIAAEFHPNHGTSLRDTVDRIETAASEAAKVANQALAATHQAAAAAQSAAASAVATGVGVAQLVAKAHDGTPT